MSGIVDVAVGQNSKKVIPCGYFRKEYYAPIGGGALVVPKATIVADAVAAGVLLNDGVTAPTDIVGAKVALKPITGEDGLGNVATTSDADIIHNTITTDLDPLGYEEIGGYVTDYNNDGVADQLLAADFAVTVAEGSIVKVAVRLV